MLYNLKDKTINIKGLDYFIADNAVIIGSVTIENNVSIWYGTVIRADLANIIIGEGSNIQDGCVLHNNRGSDIVIGKGVSVGHKAVLHSCIIGDNCLIGMGAIMLTGSKVGKNCIVGANTLITGGMDIPDNSMVVGSPGRVVRKVTESEIREIEEIAKSYTSNFKRYKTDLQFF